MVTYLINGKYYQGSLEEITIVDMSLEIKPISLSQLFIEQSEIVDHLKKRGSLVSIDETKILVKTSLGVFELPLVDTQLPAIYEHTNIPQSFLDEKKELGLREDCKYYTGHQIKQYYKDTNQDLLTQSDIESIVALMPSGEEYSYGSRGQSMRQLMTLIGMTDQDLTSRADSDGDADSVNLATYGYAWLGAKGGGDDLLRSEFDSDEADLYGDDLNDAFRARLFRKLSS